MQKRWIYKEMPHDSRVSHLAEALNISIDLAVLLLQRGIQTFEEAKDFFRPSLEDLPDPFLMCDMDKAVHRIEQAITRKERILVYGDYDVDGTTAVALVYGFLQTYHPYLDFYLPDRQKEGYGISKEGIDWASENGFSLVIALDCGIKASAVIAYANHLGIDFIICDHHLPDDTLPQAHAVLDPKRADCAYPFKELSGCGIGFKLLQAFCIRNQIDLVRLYDFIDLVALSIASDLVQMTGENRTLAYYGLQKLNSQPRVGVQALMDVSGFTKGTNVLNVSNLVFHLGPRINAVGRLGHAGNAVRLLIAQHKEEADLYAQKVNAVNIERKDIDTIATQEVLEMIRQEQQKDNKATVLYKEGWHKGILGILAARCIDFAHRPTIILTNAEDRIVGSARSVPGFDVYEAIEACADLLIQFGGHRQAAGLSLDPQNLEAFSKRFQETVVAKITLEMLIPVTEIDLKIELNQITPKFYRILSQMAPFGPENMRPVFASENLIAESVQVVRERHLKFRVKSPTGNAIFEVIGFGMAEYFPQTLAAQSINLCYTIEENYFQGKTTLQLRAKDMRFNL
jgi:single-stranded-DNA-specific exonuclease